MVQFQTLTSNFRVSTMVEHGALTFFLDGRAILRTRDSIDTKEMVLPPGAHHYQWQVRGDKDITRYAIEIVGEGMSIPTVEIGPKVLKNGDTDFDGEKFEMI